jgi:arylsulfatase A-like enzyme
VHYTDAELGRLLAATARYAPLTIVTGDHGEGLWDHGWREHGVFLYEEMVRVPWIVSWPGVIPAGRVVGGLASHVDLVPTLAALIGRPLLADARGLDLSAQLRGTAAPDPRRAIHLQRRHYDPMRRGHLRVAGDKRAIRVGDWKLILSPEELGFELYDLVHDPGERHNLAGLRPELVQELGTQLVSWQRGQHVHAAAAPPTDSPSPEVTERLRALGYVK